MQRFCIWQETIQQLAFLCCEVLCKHTSLQRNTRVAVEKEGQNIRDTLQQHRLDFRYGAWAKNLASLFISISYSLPGQAEVSRLAESKPTSRADTFSAFSSIHQESFTVAFPSVSSVKNYNWHWKQTTSLALQWQTWKVLLNPSLEPKLQCMQHHEFL